MSTAATLEADVAVNAAVDAAAGAAADTGAGMGGEGLVGVLRGMAQTLLALTRDFPTWWVAEGGVGAWIGQAQAVRELSQSLTAVIAREADARGLGVQDGLSRADWVRNQAATGLAGPAGAGGAGGLAGGLAGAGLEGPQAAAVARVAAAMN